MRSADVRTELAGWLARYRPAHLVHVGAHNGEEVPYYREAGIGRITLVEPIPTLASALRYAYPDATVVEAACSDHNGTATLTIPRRTNMATLLPASGRQVPVVLRRLDEIAPDADAAVIDVQGHELVVLDAAPWDSLRVVVVEACTVDDPAVSPPYGQVVEYMTGRGFREVACLARDYDWLVWWADGRRTDTGGEVRDVVFAKEGDEQWAS